MFIPLYDSNPTHRIPYQYVTLAIVAACVLVFLWQISLDPRSAEEAIYALGAIPAVITGQRQLPPDIAIIPSYATIITSMFLHGGWMHLIGNMVFLWVLGDNIEDAMGHMRYVVFYLVCGIAAAFCHMAADFGSTMPMVGASGAISGVIGAYLVLHPKAKIHVLISWWVVALPAWIVLGGWIALQFFNVATGGGGGIAWWAHIGGAAAGVILIPFFKHDAIPLFDGFVGEPTPTKAAQQTRARQPSGIRLVRRDERGVDSGDPRRPWR
ncbi:MAG: rhomboid family intramembrane serine protease [Rhodospirillales bacterium]